ncbi:MAG: tetratricopeptide repeat protein [Terriglobales bacterium]
MFSGKEVPIHSTCVLIAIAFWSLMSAAQAPSPAVGDIRPGEIVKEVQCRRPPACSYAIYLPSTFTPAKSWPTIFAFDPGGRGDYPVRMYKDVAEKYGYIIIGSNDSQNFGGRGAAIAPMISDAVERFAVNLHRVYTTGFSGGARVATQVALRCSEPCRVVGVVASGAAYPAGTAPSAKDSFLYFLGMGDTDFNFPEAVEMQIAKEHLGSPFRLRFFPGPHHWSPPEVFEQAIAWFQLRAMQARDIPPDTAFIAASFARLLSEYAAGQQEHDLPRQFFALKALAEDFRGLRDTTEYQKKLRDLQTSGEFKKFLEKERRQAAEQQSLTRDPSTQLGQFARTDDRENRERLRASIASDIVALAQKGQKDKDETQRRVYQRSVNALFAWTIEEGQKRQAAGKYSEAAPYYEILLEATPERPWPALLLAEVRVALGDKKRALQAIERAVHTGQIDAAALEQDRDLAPLFGDPEFQRIIGGLKQRAPAKTP